MTIAAVVWPLHMPFAGVTHPQEAGFNPAFETRLQALAQAALFTQDIPGLAVLERPILLRRVTIARSQAALFWYLAAEAYIARLLWLDAYQAIEFCLRALDVTNDHAKAQVHTLRYRIAFQRRRFQEVRASCQIALVTVQKLSLTNACPFPLYDLQGLLAAARAMSQRVRFFAEN